MSPEGPGQTGGESKLWITDEIVRHKNPEADLRRQYGQVFRICTAISFVLHGAVAAAFQKFEPPKVQGRKAQQVIQMDDLPETRQIKRPPPPPRPAVPIETESEDVPDDVTIESTDLDFDEAPIDLPPPPPPGSRDGDAPPEEEEIVEFWAVEKKPELVKQVMPVYPEVARKAGLEGVVYVQFVVGANGRVKNAVVLRGPEIFREAALNAIVQFTFKPAVQNDRNIPVRMSMPIRFRLAESG